MRYVIAGNVTRVNTFNICGAFNAASNETK